MVETRTYDGYKLYETLGELQGLFAELRYIDTAMQYLGGEESGWLADVAGGLITGIDYVQVEFGNTFPFTKVYRIRNDWVDSPFDDTKTERLGDRLTELGNEANDWAATEIANVKELIEPFTWPQSSSYENNCVQPVGDMHGFLEGKVREDFGLLKHTLGDWKGDAADNFASYFYFPFERTLRSQKKLLTALMGGIASAKAIAESSQHSIMNVVYAAKDAVVEQLQRAQATAGLERQASGMKTLIIAGGVATVFAGIFTAGAAAGAAAGLWAAAFTVVAGSSQLATVGIPSGGSDPFEVKGSTAAELSDSLVNALDNIKTNDGNQHDLLWGEIDAVLRRVDMLHGGPDGEDGRLVPIQPDIVHGVDADDFYLP
jgi:hypothetical protein